MLELLFALFLFTALLVALPLLLLKMAFGVLGFVVALPFKLLGGLLHVAGGLLKLGLGLVGLVVLLVVLPLLVALVPVALATVCIFIGVKVLAAIF